MKNYLLIDFGSTNTKLTAVDLEGERIIATTKAVTTVDTDINIGYKKALNLLNQKVGKLEFDKVIACSSAAGGLKMAAIGLVEELTVEAAKRVCYGAGGKVDLVFSHFITASDVKQIIDKKIDIILLAGGIDGGNRESVIFNAQKLGEGGVKVPIIYAGNKSCQDEIKAIFEKYHLQGYICDNIMPRLNVLNINPARDIIREVFMKNIVFAKGIKKLEEKIDDVILPTPQAVLQAAELLSKGYLDETGFGEMIIVDIGGATTDIYSIGSGRPKRADVILKGLEEPFAKRTVEGDLGMRYSAGGVMHNLTREEHDFYLSKGIDIDQEAAYRFTHIDMIPTTKRDEEIDELFGKICADVAFSRHDGKMEAIYTPLGQMYYQYGKDLSDVQTIIGTGGVIIHDKNPREILKALCYNPQKPLELRPRNPQFKLDKNYILSAMGLLSIYEPLIALRIMKKNIIDIEEDNESSK